MNKIIVLLFFMALASLKAGAHDRCEVYLNKQLIFKGEVEQENPVAHVTSRLYKATDCITVKYYSEQISKGWTRTFYFNGSDDKNIRIVEMAKQNGSVAVKASAFRNMMRKNEPVYIYTVSLPVDKTLASRIRVRRMLICKIVWN